MRFKVLISSRRQPFELFKAPLCHRQPQVCPRMVLEDFSPEGDPKVATSNAQFLHSVMLICPAQARTRQVDKGTRPQLVRSAAQVAEVAYLECKC